MSKLQIVTEGYIKDTKIRGILRDLAQYSSEFSDNISYCGEDNETCEIHVYIDLYTQLEELFSEVQDCNENGKEHEEFDDNDMYIITELMEVLRDTENNHMTFFTCK